MIQLRSKGDFSKTEKFIDGIRQKRYRNVLNRLASKGVAALASATPKRTGKTANSWYYEIEEGENYTSIVFKNSNISQNWANVAILLQYGHGTRNGGYVEGIDYINPALKPIFDEIADKAWKEVTYTYG